MRLPEWRAQELAIAFDGFRITLSDRRDARYRVRVVQELVSAAMHRKTWIAGHTFVSGFGGAGEVSFLYFASGAQVYAPPDLPRPELIAAIGRGIGRGAAHEFAHLIGYAAHDSRDRGSYEYQRGVATGAVTSDRCTGMWRRRLLAKSDWAAARSALLNKTDRGFPVA